MKNNDTLVSLKPDDVRQMLINACDELAADQNGLTAGDVITRFIGHESGDIDIKKLRELYGCTQDEMASAIDVTPSAIKSWEQGVRKPRGPSKIILEAMAIVAIRKHKQNAKEGKCIETTA